MLLIYVICGRKTQAIHMYPSATISEVFDELEKRNIVKVTKQSPFWLEPQYNSDIFIHFLGNEGLKNFYPEYDYPDTIEDYGFFDGCQCFILLQLRGGGKFVSYLSKIPGCPNDVSDCDFDNPNNSNELCNISALMELGNTTEDAWLLFCNLFGLDSYQNVIIANSDSSSIRLVDVIHRLYHRNPNITWDKIQAEVIKYDRNLANAIDYHVKQAKKFN